MKTKGRPQPELARYAAKLLFQTRVIPDYDRRKRRGCEERIFVFEATTAKAALAAAKRRGRSLCHHYKNIYGQPVRYEFIGVVELLALAPCYIEPDEVWLDFSFRITPMERRGKLIPAQSDLYAIRNNQ